jgi:hypothetical protein
MSGSPDAMNEILERSKTAAVSNLDIQWNNGNEKLSFRNSFEWLCL